VRKFAAAAVAVVSLCAFAGCGGSGNRHAAPPQRAASPPKVKAKAPARHPIQTCHAGSEERVGTSRLAYAAIVRRRALAYRAPGRRPFASFGRLNVNGAVNVFGVVGQVVRRDCSAGWYRVELPIRPNGSWGYVKARAIELSAVRTRIVVDLSARRLTFYRNGRPVLHAVAAVGAPATPTPTGRFYVNQRLIPSNPSGPWGPGAIGISAHSSVLQDSWTQGAPIAIHGTDEPSSIGHAASHGCIRLDNAVLQRLFARTPAGTPVIIRA
jgi:lipoprotein-anchoring transpeptidase ErfK/SrfK